ncbi:CcoQ/FixQ family Cbb3-type cytochrome c oxidase assembly chaperone [Vibrio parahaemolyticus]|uniref:cbb3-type cytochrome oxidase subunit 3 n=1 Tax=Vibrio sp. A1-1 TaxID=2912250 RepID=UPI001F3D3B1A|nr:CcoQ/FixQ family Cbb3-type cytochrome c oxidase assembly chaperone [Vibrio sp. A1-1]MCF7453656.1 CcoQ/FixQ family Cbb3-type cytochrome c oxidase assembly chaperone [Vibrio sp. A1-1]HCG8163631.1 cbb3-type cytochrome oxidase subunit 3 [Vibrio parahaemolyticus]
MDFGTIHSIYTVVLFASFICIVWWAFSKKRKARFEEDANLVFADEEQTTPNNQGVKK